ncbi:MAG: Leucinerich repeat protein-like protein [Cyanobacteria bacterium RYN_339]|nr:Leucinerich repeat protein-like protein [Cyanobacteria bacterium RYN_339]
MRALVAGLCLFLGGCAGQVPVAAPAAVPNVSFALDVAPAPTVVAPVTTRFNGAAVTPLARTSQPASNAKAPAAPAPAGGGNGGGAGGGSGLPLPLPPAPGRINLHALDRVAATPVAEGPLAKSFRQVAGVAVDTESSMVYAADPLLNQIRAIAPDGRSWVVAGGTDGTSGFDGENIPATVSRLDAPVGLAFDEPSAALLVADGGNHRVRYFQPGGQIYTLAGGGSDAGDTVAVASTAQIGQPFGVAGDLEGHTWFTERDTGKVRRVTGIGMLETMVQLPGGHAGAIAVQAATGLVWVTDDQTIYRIDPTQTPVQAVPAFAPHGGRITALAHDQRDGLIMAMTSDMVPGEAETKLWRIALDKHGLALGSRADWLAGTGSSGSSAAAYALPATTVPDATTQLLAGAGFCSLAVDWTRAVDRPDASGLIYSGTSYAAADAAAYRAEVFRLTPRATK